MLTRTQKEAIIVKAKDCLEKSKSVVFVDYKGLPIADFNAVKKELRESGTEFRVIKKRLFKRAADESGITVADDTLGTQFAAAFSLEDEVSAAKILEAFAKKNDKLRISGGILEGVVIDEKAVRSLAKLPGKQELLGRLVGTIQGPITGFVRVLSGNSRSLVQVLKAIAEAR